MKTLLSAILILVLLICDGCTTTPAVPSEILAISKSGISDIKDFGGVFEADGKWLGEMARLQVKNRRWNPNRPDVAPDPRFYDLLGISYASGRNLHSADRFSIELAGDDLLRITARNGDEVVVSEEFKRGVAFDYRDGVITLLHREPEDSSGYLTRRTEVSLMLGPDHGLIVTRRDAGLAGWLIVIVPEKWSESAQFKKRG